MPQTPAEWLMAGVIAANVIYFSNMENKWLTHYAKWFITTLLLVAGIGAIFFATRNFVRFSLWGCTIPFAFHFFDQLLNGFYVHKKQTDAIQETITQTNDDNGRWETKKMAALLSVLWAMGGCFIIWLITR